MTEAAIEVSALSMRYPKVPRYRDIVLRPFRREHVQALDGVSLSVPRGELFGFIGPNGAGKTTLIKILTTLILPSSGGAEVGGHDVARSPESVKRMVGLVMSDERSFYWRLTGRQNLRFFSALHGMGGREAARRIDELFELLGMSDRADDRFSDYSSGTKQKMAIARGLLAEPSIIFFDEPTRSLDPLSAAQIRSFVRGHLVRDLGKTVFLTTHNLYEAEEIADRVGIINRGRLLAVGSVSEISARLRRRERYRLRLASGAGDLVAPIRAVSGVIEARPMGEGERRDSEIELFLSDADRAVPEIIAMIVARGARMIECVRSESSLSEIFSEIITEDAHRGDAA